MAQNSTRLVRCRKKRVAARVGRQARRHAAKRPLEVAGLVAVTVVQAADWRCLGDAAVRLVGTAVGRPDRTSHVVAVISTKPAPRVSLWAGGSWGLREVEKHSVWLAAPEDAQKLGLQVGLHASVEPVCTIAIREAHKQKGKWNTH